MAHATGSVYRRSVKGAKTTRLSLKMCHQRQGCFGSFSVQVRTHPLFTFKYIYKCNVYNFCMLSCQDNKLCKLLRDTQVD